MAEAERRLMQLGIELPNIPPPAGNYVPFVRSGNLLFVSGQIAIGPDGSPCSGRVGVEVSVQEAVQAARQAGISLLAAVQAALGSLDCVTRVVRIGGFVNAEPGFSQQPQVINGCSDLMVEVFGDRGRHARAAIGSGSLPANAPVEVDGIFEVGNEAV